MKRIALVTLFAFACTTVRVPAVSPNDVVDAPGTVAPPLLELWLESADDIPRGELDRAAELAHGAIAQAVAGVQVSPSAMGASDAVLFVRERGVALTSARSRQQTWAKIGIVAAVAAVIIGAVAAGRSGGGRHFSRAAVPRGGGVARASGPVVTRAARPVFTRPGAPPRFLPRYYAPSPIFIDIGVVIPLQPLVVRDGPEDQPPPFPPDAPVPLIEAVPPPPDQQALYAANDEPLPPDDLPALELPLFEAPADFDVESRDFFDGPRIGLQLDLLDRATGDVLWSKPVAADGNPCDAGDVTKLLRSALEGQPWAQPVRSARR